MTIGEWIDRRTLPVPAAFRPYLHADGPVSCTALLAAAETRLEVCARSGRRDRTAAFSLLAADAYITYACLQAILAGGESEALREITEWVGRGWIPEEPA